VGPAVFRSPRPGNPNLRASRVTVTPATHQVVEEHGAHVFLEPRAASYLDDKLLDANIDGQQVRFAVSDQR
jgi:iron-sulfur cluster assembly protein